MRKWDEEDEEVEKNQVEILVENLLFQEMNEEKFFICLILWMSGRTLPVTLK